MTGNISPLAGKPAPSSMLINIPKLITAYYTERPDPTVPLQRVTFGTSGHRGSAFDTTFNEWHILAITQAICLYRQSQSINGPLFLGIDTHALSQPAFVSALEVLAANGVTVMLAARDEYTPTPVVSHAILSYNRGRRSGLSDGIIITPSHNPPQDGGFKYNPVHGGPADVNVTSWIEKKANFFIEKKLKGVKRVTFTQAIHAKTTHRYDYLHHYVNDLDTILDMPVIRRSNIHIGVDPLGGAGVHYWGPIAERYKLNMTIVNQTVDPTFRFMAVDWDGQIRMNPASPYAMASLLKLKKHFDITLACDTDHDRHGIMTPHAGLLLPNHYFAVAIDYLFQHRPQWPKKGAVSKTVVTSSMIDKITAKMGRQLYEVPVGFKWFVHGLLNGQLQFCCEESAGATFSRMNGKVWTTDKDGIVSALLAAEITAKLDRDIGDLYKDCTKQYGTMFYAHANRVATAEQKSILKNISIKQINCQQLGDEPIEHILIKAPGNGAPIDGVKLISENNWLVIRPSGTEAIYEIYAESAHSKKHLQTILNQARVMVRKLIGE